MKFANAAEPLDHKTLILRLWWGRAVLAFTAATLAGLAVKILSWMVDGGAASTVAGRTFFDSPTFWPNVMYTLAIAPFVETAVMARMIDLVLRATRSRAVAIVMTAGIAASVHRLFTNESGWYAFLPFVAFALVYIKRSAEPQRDGFIVAAMSQAFFNVTSLLSMVAVAFAR